MFSYYHQTSIIIATLTLSVLTIVDSYDSITSDNDFSLSNGSDDRVCLGDCTETNECTFTFEVNLFASELGYFKVKECGDIVMPTLGIEKGKTYHFKQYDISNYYHPLGFAYYPDGAHDDVDELEPGVTPPNSKSFCSSTMTCPAPMYMLNGKNLGTYNNNNQLGPVTMNEEDFGLDFYEPDFYLAPEAWTENGDYSVYLKFDDEDFTQDIFYFCHIHQYMSGRIKFVDDVGRLLHKDDLPIIPYEYEKPSPYDESCGTYNISEFQLPNKECAPEYVCDRPVEQPELHNFTGCIDSMNCAMQVGMTTHATEKLSSKAISMR